MESRCRWVWYTCRLPFGMLICFDFCYRKQGLAMNSWLVKSTYHAMPQDNGFDVLLPKEMINRIGSMYFFRMPCVIFCRLYLEGSRRFLLSAKLFEKVFYISSHEDFPCYSKVPKRGIIATLKYTILHDKFFIWIRQRKDAGFLLCSTHCRYCDYDLGRYYCCNGSTQREVLAKINHVFVVTLFFFVVMDE